MRAPAATSASVDDLLESAAATSVASKDWRALLALAALQPDAGAAWRARALWGLGRLDELADHLDAVGWDLVFEDRAEALVDVHLHLGNPSRALWWLYRASDDPTARSLARVANGFTQQGTRGAWSMCAALILDRVAAGHPATGSELGHVLSQAVQWRHPSAVPLADARCRAVSASPWSWWWVARAHASGGDRDKAREAVDAALAIDADFTPAHRLATLLDRAEPDRPKAADDEAAKPPEDAEPSPADGIDRLVRAGDYSGAIAIGQRLVGSTPSIAALSSLDVARRRLADLRPIRRPLPRVSGYVPTAGTIMHIVGRTWPTTQSGYTIRTRSVLEAQSAAGLNPIVASGPGDPWSHLPGFHQIEEATNGAVLVRSPGLEPHLRRVAAMVRRHRPSILHAASDFRNALVALELGRAFSIPVVYEVRGLWEETWLSRQGPEAAGRDAFRFRREVETQSMVEADAVVTLSETLRTEIAHRGIPPDRITVVPNAVDVDRFTPRARPGPLADRLDVPRDAVVVGCITSVVGYEGLPLLVRAIAELRREGHPVVGLIVGDGPDRRAVEATAQSLGVYDSIRFTGQVPHSEIPDHYALLDVFVLPRTDDRVCHLVTPLKPFEAMAMGRPLVVSSVEPLTEIVEEGVTGLSFDPEDLDGLVAALRTLVGDAALRRELGTNASVEARRSHSWQSNGLRYVDLYRRLGIL